MIDEFDALKDAEPCETINVQVVADFVTIIFYRNENENSIIRRELIPSHAIQHIWVKDFAGTSLTVHIYSRNPKFEPTASRVPTGSKNLTDFFTILRLVRLVRI